MAGGRPATHRALPTARTQALSDEKTRQGVLVHCVYLVVAGSVEEPQTLMPLAAYSCESLAQAFIGRAPLPQRSCLGIQRWLINQPSLDPYWTGTAVAPTAGNTLHLDEAYRRFREKLLLCADGGNRNASTEGN
jgi:hypothetical protein